MKVFVFNYRDFDEAEYFTKESEALGVELGICRETPTLANIDLAAGYDCISIITTPIDAALMKRIKELGIKMVSTRTIGYDHVDIKAAKELGIKVSNATYSPNGVADYAIMLMLMASRKMKHIMERADIRDFSLKGIQGREFASFTVGIIGTGRIGRTVVRHLSGFGCRILAYDLYESEEVKQYATYVPLEEIWEQCDLISFHAPLTDENFHMVNAEIIAKMKDRVILVNTARGGLIDSQALIDAIESGKVGAVVTAEGQAHGVLHKLCYVGLDDVFVLVLGVEVHVKVVGILEGADMLVDTIALVLNEGLEVLQVVDLLIGGEH